MPSFFTHENPKKQCLLPEESDGTCMPLEVGTANFICSKLLIEKCTRKASLEESKSIVDYRDRCS